MRNYESLLVETPVAWEDYTPQADAEETELSAECELNFEE